MNLDLARTLDRQRQNWQRYLAGLQSSTENTQATMTLPKAIELLQAIQYQENDPNTPDIKDALKLALFIMQLYERGDLHYEPLS